MDTAQAVDAVEAWLNTGQAPVDNGDTVLLYTWRYADMASRSALSTMQQLQDAYGGAGLQVVGIHTPLFSFEADPDNVARAVERYGVAFPVGVHTSLAATPLPDPALPRTVVDGPTGSPATAPADTPAELESTVRQELRRSGADLGDRVFDQEPSYAPQPVPRSDVYAGAAYGGPLGNDHQAAAHTPVTFTDDGSHRLAELYLDGKWRQEDEHAVAVDPGHAAVRVATGRCGIVVGPAGAECTVRVYGGPVPDTMHTGDLTVEDGETRVAADEPGLYTVLQRDAPRVAELEIIPRSEPFRLYAVCSG